MTFPATTAFYAGILALLYVGLSGWVVAGRVSGDTLQGDGGDETLAKRIRAQGNFGEYVPFALLLIALLETGGAGQTLLKALLIILLVARVLHPFGMFAAKKSPGQFVCRGGGILGTFGVIVATAVCLIIQLGR